MTGVVPLDPLHRIEVLHMTGDNSFGLPQGEADGWARFTGLAIPHTLSVARSTDGRWLIGIAHAGVMEALLTDHLDAGVRRPDGGPAVAVDALGPMIRRIARLARTLPTAPLDEFRHQTRDLPRTTEAERLVVQRIGQNVFRDALLTLWNGRCPLTGIAHPLLLRASHLKPWADCLTDAERLDVHNGLLLAAHLDAAFDAGLIGFRADGALLVSPALAADDADRLGLHRLPPLRGLLPRHEPYLEYHRRVVFGGRAQGGDRDQRQAEGTW